MKKLLPLHVILVVGFMAAPLAAQEGLIERLRRLLRDPAPAAAPPEITARAVAIEAAMAGRRAGKRSWGPEQVTGKPDTPGAGDIETAWASRTQDGQDEWLEVEFEEAVEPAAVIVHETYNPGAVYKIVAYSESGMAAEVWEGEDPTARGALRGVSEIQIDAAIKTKCVRVHLKSTEVPGWNEIDAIGLKDADGKVQWAIRAKASSSFASDRQPDEGPEEGEVPRAAAVPVARRIIGLGGPAIVIEAEPELGADALDFAVDPAIVVSPLGALPESPRERLERTLRELEATRAVIESELEELRDDLEENKELREKTAKELEELKDKDE